jgi:hypothetical protein
MTTRLWLAALAGAFGVVTVGLVSANTLATPVTAPVARQPHSVNPAPPLSDITYRYASDGSNLSAVERALLTFEANPVGSIKSGTCELVYTVKVCTPFHKIDGTEVPAEYSMEAMLGSATQAALAVQSDPALVTGGLLQQELGDPSVQRSAFAETTLQELLYRTAAATGQLPSSSEVVAYADAQAAGYAQAIGVPSMPTGFFTSADALSRYSRLLAVHRQMSAIESSSPSSHTAALRSWLQQQLSVHSVVINDVTQDVTLADALPIQE